MINLLNTLGFPGIVLLFMASLFGIIILLKYILKREAKEVLAHPPTANVLQKKYPGVDINNYKGLIYNIGLIFTLSIVLAIFEFPDYEEQSLVQLTSDREMIEEMQEIPPTEHKPPPPPKITQPEIVEVPDEVEIEEEIEIDLDVEASEDEIVEEVEVNIEEEQEVEVAEEIFQIVEDPATPSGGYKEFYAFVGKNLKYPRKALDVGVAGKVYVQFVVDKDGSLTNMNVVRGIGFGCDEEAIRVLALAPKWKPGKQRGVAVKQIMVIPITFKIADM
ncbi:energy transducer TonB [Flexithrix dorotheae]|uniref:energy transducer TonB n=1 Tax=Flexithrix dorotheae TaxID=70993 RepID=UPI00036C2333|nr:energy transducer TonB [Flexithrix dorotheae]